MNNNQNLPNFNNQNMNVGMNNMGYVNPNPVPVENPITPPQPEANNQIVLGTTSNVTYNDTVGDVFTSNQVPVQNVPSEPQVTNQFIPTNIPEQPQMMMDPMFGDTTPQLDGMDQSNAYNAPTTNEAPSYVNDPQVVENVQMVTGQKKATIPVSKELKTVAIIVIVLLAFVIVIPYLVDLMNKVRFR